MNTKASRATTAQSRDAVDDFTAAGSLPIDEPYRSLKGSRAGRCGPPGDSHPEGAKSPRTLSVTINPCVA